VLCTATPPDIPRTTELVTNEVDLLIDVPLLDVPTLREDPGIRLAGGPTNRLCVLLLNLDRPVISDPRVRRLLSTAIDRQALVKAATGNEAVPASALIPTEHWAGLDYTIDTADPGDVRDQLAALGEPPGMELRLVASDADASLANACVLLQEQLAWAGIALSLDLLDAGAMGGTMEEGGWDLLMAHTPFWRDPHELIRPLVTGDGAFNRGGYANPRVDYLANLAARSRHTSYRAGFYRTIQEIVATDVPVIPLYFPNYYDGMSTRLQNYPFLPPVSAAAMCQVTMAKPEPVEIP
jgi:peptide/nickel transport system substrate-binding protein